MRHDIDAMTVDSIGRVIDGRYVVEGVIGRGGMGIVLRARHTFTRAQVALKMLHGDLQVDEQMQQRFIYEARASSAIGHPGIVQVFDGGRTPEGELYLAMELLSGRTLRRAMNPPPEIARRIVLELLDALAAAHASGIVHRDLKPDNVFLCDPHGQVKLLDFGIAKILQNASRAGLTDAGAVLGTLLYMAPEQLMDASSVDYRADLWAVGVILYELISGKPYRGTTAHEIMFALVQSEPDPITTHVDVDPTVAAFFARALAHDRSRRFASAPEMAAAVAAMSGHRTAPHVIGVQTVGTGVGGTAATGVGPYAVPITSIPERPAIPHPSMPQPSMPAPATPAMPSSMHAPSTPAPSTPTRRRWLGVVIAGAVLAVAAVVVAIVVAGGSTTAQPDAALAVEDAVAADAVVVVDRDPWESQRPKSADPEECAPRCQGIQACGYEPVDACMRMCKLNPTFRDCIATSDCFDVSRCYVGMGCPKRPSGTKSCLKTIECITKCKTGDCTCGCFGDMAPQHAVLIGRFTFCAYACGTAGNVDACKARCAGIVKTCAKR